MDGKFLVYPASETATLRKKIVLLIGVWRHASISHAGVIGSIWIPNVQSKLFTAINFLCYFGDPDFVPSFFLFSTKFGLYANLSARMQWSRNQKRLRTISPAAGMVVATQPAVGATLVLRPPGKEPWKALRGAQGAAGWRKGRFHSSASCLKLIRRNLDDYEKYLGWWNDWFSLELLGYMIYKCVFHMFFMVCKGIFQSKKTPDIDFWCLLFCSPPLCECPSGHWCRWAGMRRAGWGSVVGLWAMGKWCTKVREWTNCGQLAQ